MLNRQIRAYVRSSLKCYSTTDVLRTNDTLFPETVNPVASRILRPDPISRRNHKKGSTHNDAKNCRSSPSTSNKYDERVARKEEKIRKFLAVDDQDDDDSVEFTPFVVEKHSPLYYKELCRRLGGEGKIAEAVAVVEKLMYENRVRPEKFNYITVIHILAKAGQARKAMEFFKKIRTAGYQPGPHTITSLMNACANAPTEDADFALQQTKWLFRREKHMYGIPKTPAIYFAAMKCFARHGDIEAVFRLADQMVEDGWYAGNRIFAYLLSAALSDKEAGFLLALQVWRTLKRLKMPVELSHYNLLVRACRDCGLGEKGNNLLKMMTREAKSISPPSENSLRTATERTELADTLNSGDNAVVESANSAIAANLQHISNYHVSDREKIAKLSLLGGAEQLLMQMKSDRVEPDLKFFSVLLHVLPNSMQSETDLIRLMDETKVAPDTEFYNQLIFRRAKRNASTDALNCLDDVRRRKLKPDYRTFVALSMTCHTGYQSLSLLRDMEAANVIPNLRIFQNFLHNIFCYRYNFLEVRSLLKQMSKFNIEPDKSLLVMLESKLVEAKKIAAKSKYANDSVPEESSVSIRGLDEFPAFFDEWLRSTKVSKLAGSDPKLTILDKNVNVDDLREDWEKPWLKDEATKSQPSLDDDIEIVPSSSFDDNFYVASIPRLKDSEIEA